MFRTGHHLLAFRGRLVVLVEKQASQAQPLVHRGLGNNDRDRQEAEGVCRMRAKLRAVGNSIGLTIPANELRTVGAKAGDEVELEIKRVIRTCREGWDDPEQWKGAENVPPMLDELPGNDFDAKEWEW